MVISQAAAFFNKTGKFISVNFWKRGGTSSVSQFNSIPTYSIEDSYALLNNL